MTWRIETVTVLEDGDFGLCLVSSHDEDDVASAVVSVSRGRGCARFDPDVRVWRCEASTRESVRSARVWLQDAANKDAIVSACEQGRGYRPERGAA